MLPEQAAKAGTLRYSRSSFL